LTFVDSNVRVYLTGAPHPHKREAIGPMLQATLDMIDDVFPIRREDVLRASEILQHPAALSARDAIHVAVMGRHGVRTILTFDTNFDRRPSLKRIFRLKPRCRTLAVSGLSKPEHHAETHYLSGI